MRERIPLSPAETSVAAFVLCALVASVSVRLWTVLAAPHPRPVPAEFATLDSVFEARSRTPVVAVTARDDGAFWSSARSSGKQPPAPHSIDLNVAGPEQLRRLPAVGPALAARIIAFRRATPFRKPEDLLRVEGIGKKKWARMQPFVIVQ